MIHGTCSLCGGPVATPAMWSGVLPPTPTCQRCGATPREAHGPVIDMVRRPQQQGRPMQVQIGVPVPGTTTSPSPFPLHPVDWSKVR